jgi:predicted neuraminidase
MAALPSWMCTVYFRQYATVEQSAGSPCFAASARALFIYSLALIFLLVEGSIPARGQSEEVVCPKAVADGMVYERVIGPEFPGKYKHPASIEHFSNGDLYIAYYGGDGEYAEQTAVYGMRKVAGKSEWSQPHVIAETPFYSDGNAVIWQAPDSVVWLFYVCRYGDTWSTSRIKAKLSYDLGNTWTDSFMVALEEGMMVCKRPVVLNNGDYLLPIYHETGHDTEMVGPDSTSRFLRFTPGQKRWNEMEPIRSARGNIQPAVVQLTDSHLVAYCRRGGGYGPGQEGYIVRAHSHDGGYTWSQGEDTSFPNPNAAIDLLKLPSGNLLLVYNNSFLERTPLSIAVSTDTEKSWSKARDLATADLDYGYPFAIVGKDDKVHMVFTSHSRSVVNYVSFDESFVMDSAR